MSDESRSTRRDGRWIPIGIGLGAGLGVAIKNIPAGVGIGAAIGVVMTLVMRRKKPRLP